MTDTAIVCPACQSKLTADGRTLVERSAHLLELEEAADTLPKIEKELERLQRSRKLSAPEPKPAPARPRGRPPVRREVEKPAEEKKPHESKPEPESDDFF